MSDEELIRLIEENPKTFSRLMELYYRPIFGYVLRRTGDAEEAADISSETFMKAFLHLQRYRYEGKPIRNWLYRIATNETNMHFRRKKRMGAFLDRVGPELRRNFDDNWALDREQLDRELKLHEQFQTVLTALKTLPAAYQDVLSLRYFEGKDNREVADILMMKEGTVKSLVSRGLEKLRMICNPSQA
ncbi:MAG: RNA polymerase sigma factor [Bacteroidetes bacterium]|nr:RNA polymerase sigma factor [Bacteroidota bacterium]